VLIWRECGVRYNRQ
jgi:transposase